MLPRKCATLPCKPSVTVDDARQFILEKWRFSHIKDLRELVSYDCRTYFAEADDGKYIFKIVNDIDSRKESYFEAFAQLLDYLESTNILAQRLVRPTNGGQNILQFSSQYHGAEKGEPLKSFLLTFIEGGVLANEKISPELCKLVAAELIKLTKCVDKIHPMPRFFKETAGNNIWRMENAGSIESLIPFIETAQQRQLLTAALNRFEGNLKPILGNLTQGFVHGDPNESNIIIGADKSIHFIDWQDIGISYRVYDLAILVFSMILTGCKSSENLDIENIGLNCLEGFLLSDPPSLTEMDVEALASAIECRVAVSLCVGQYTYNYLNTGNEYLLTTARSGWSILEDLLANGSAYTLRWREAQTFQE